MSVIRVNKTTNYTVMSNYHLRDKRMSLKAKGLLSQKQNYVFNSTCICDILS